MCFCRRKDSSKEDAVESSRRGADNSRKNGREQPLPAPQMNVASPLGGQQQVPMNQDKQRTEKRGKKSFPREKRISKKRPKKAREDDTISNIPDEMPDLEINREHAEPFYTDEQLM